FLGAALVHVERGQLGDDGRGRGIERHRPFVRRNRAGHIVSRLETPREEELFVRSGDRFRRLDRRRRGRVLARPGRRNGERERGRDHKMHTIELFHKSAKLSYSSTPCPWILSCSKFSPAPTARRRSRSSK